MSTAGTLQASAQERARRQFAADVREGFARTPKQLPSKYFYDALGSSLFEAICQLPWYRITRAELALLHAHAKAMVDGMPTPIHLVELGCGSGEKLAAVVEACGGRLGSVQLVDVSQAALDATALRLDRLGVTVHQAHAMSYEDGLAEVARSHPDAGSVVVLCLGSNIGNFDDGQRQALLGDIRKALRPGDGLLLGTDLVKPASDLRLAYDDPLGVTAAFNLNVLRRVNDELGGAFDLGAFEHRAIWNAEARRVEMHLVSRRAQTVTVAALGQDVHFAAGEWIWTESSYKYDAAEVRAFAAQAGFGPGDQWVDEQAGFAVTRLLAAPDGSGRRPARPS